MLVIHPQPAQSIRQAASGIFAGMDEIERSAIRDEGYDPDDPRVIAALDRVRAALASGLDAATTRSMQVSLPACGCGGTGLVAGIQREKPGWRVSGHL